MSTETAHQAADTERSAVIPEWTIGDKLRKIRRMQNMTQAEFASALGIGKASLQSWESEHSRPTYQALMVVAMQCEFQFGVPVDWVMEGDERVTEESLAFARRVGSSTRLSGAEAISGTRRFPRRRPRYLRFVLAA